MYIKTSKNSYYNLIKGKTELKDRKKFLYPETIKTVENKEIKYISLHFSEEDYGIDSYSFGKAIAGKNFIIVETKFREKTCACKNSGTYFKGFFLIYDNNILRIFTDKKLNILNKKEVYDFCEKYYQTRTPENIYTISDIIKYINKKEA